MVNNNGQSSGAFEDMGARVGILSQRVATIETSFVELRKDFSTSVSAITNSINALAGKVDERNKPQWGLLVSLAAFIMLFLTTLGGMAYAPIYKSQSSLETSLDKVTTAQALLFDTLRTDYLSRTEADARAVRSKEDRDRVEKSLDYFRDNVFPREVHIQRWARFDSDIAAVRHDMDLQVANLQRQIEQLQKAQSDTYTARDAIIENKDQIRRLEDQIRLLLERRSP